MIARWTNIDDACARSLHYPAQLLLLALRLALAWIFFKSGLLKVQSWDSTLALFEYEYAVPLLTPYAAAVLATIAELTLPPLLALGLLTRPAALALFAVNIVAWVSYPDLSPAGSKEHQAWALGFLILVCMGAGVASVDYLMRRQRGKATEHP